MKHLLLKISVLELGTDKSYTLSICVCLCVPTHTYILTKPL